MTVEIRPEIESKLMELARRRNQSVESLVGDILVAVVTPDSDEPGDWVQATQRHLPQVWPAEDFSSWQPPHAAT